MSLIYCHDQFIKQHHQEHWQHNDVDLYMSQNKQVCTQRKTNPMYMLYEHLLRLMQKYIHINTKRKPDVATLVSDF